MPRQPRLDAPGLIHHVIARGVNKQNIFHDSRDRENFLSRFADAIDWSGARCFAWALMSNHFHLLFQTGRRTIGQTLQRVLTGYALRFNRRYDRVGHLFQGRFKSIVCDADPYFKELVRYIHLNALRGGLVATLPELDHYPWSGHAVLMGNQKASWQEVGETLSWFGRVPALARPVYRSFIADGIDLPEDNFLEAGVGLRTLIGSPQASTWSDANDVRILGDSDFASGIMRDSENEKLAQMKKLRSGITLEQLSAEVCRESGVSLRELQMPSRDKKRGLLRAKIAYRAVDEIGWRAVDVSRFLGIGESGILAARQRGRQLLSLV